MSYCQPHNYYLDAGCPICALEKRVEELEKQILPSGPVTLNGKPLSSTPKLHSGFTIEEWQMMFRDGPLLLAWMVDFKVWADKFDGENFCGSVNATYFPQNTRLIEQPNWRPHLTNECPVPRMVKVKCLLKTGPETSAEFAYRFDWNKTESDYGIRAYRIIGVEDK